jgi:predicted small lipoprotein YifL
MLKRYARQIGVVGFLVLAVTLSGCGNSKKGGSYLPPPHGTHHSATLSTS